MEKTVAVFYEGQLAWYNVKGGKNGNFIARLCKYKGLADRQPPFELSLHKEGRHWNNGGTNQDLLDDIGNAIEWNVST